MFEWIKALHVISVIAWMAGLLYLPRLFVYHADTEPGSEASETFKVMERRLYRFIMLPAMLAAWGFGLVLAWLAAVWTDGWFIAKFVLVLAMSAYNDFCGRWLREFAADQRKRRARFYRFVNEIPTLIMIGAVILVIVRPF